MRDAVREFVSAECSPRNTLSLDRSIAGGEGGTITLLDILPARVDPLSLVCLREYEQLARKRAREFVEDMSDRERIAFIAKESGLSLAHESVEEAAGCRKSVLSTAYRNAVARIVERLRIDYPDDDRESVLVLALMTIKELTAVLAEHGSADSSYTRLFASLERRHLELAKA